MKMPSLMKNQSIICFANDWDSDPTSKHQIMRILSRSNKILWVNSISMRRPTLTGSDVRRIWTKIKGWFQGLKRVNENLYHFTPIVLPFPSSKAARIINKYLLKISLGYYIRKLKMRDVQLWTFLPNVVEWVGSLGENIIIYYCVDEWSKFSFMDGKAMREFEIKLLKKADLVITSAEHLYQDKSKFNHETHLVTHGVDYDYFSKVLSNNIPIAEDIKDIKKPIIGFFGLIHEWIDLDLIEMIATTHPEWSVVLIGKASVDIKRLRQYNNIHFLGQKPYGGLINYCKAFDIGLIPFLINEMTINVNPIKLREYLAAGIPTVSTPLPEVKRYNNLVEIGYTHEEVIKKIDGLLKEESYEKKYMRSRKMMQETWERKIEDISVLISSVIK